MKRSLIRLVAAAMALFAFALPASGQSGPLTPQAAQKLAQGTFREYLELLSMPNDAIVPADIQKNVDWLERAFRRQLGDRQH